MSLATVIQRVQTLFSDRGESWCDKDYVTGFLSIINDDLQTLLEAFDLSYQEDDIVLSVVPAGTADLSAYQSEGNALDDMMAPISLEWRRVGEDDSEWKPVQRVDKVSDTSVPNNQVEGISNFSWKRGVIKISKSSIDVDIRVTAEMLPDVLQSDSDNYIKGATNVLVYRTCQSIAFDRGGAVSKMAPVFEKKALKAEDDLECTLVKLDQDVKRRFAGRRSQVPGARWVPPTG